MTRDRSALRLGLLGLLGVAAALVASTAVGSHALPFGRALSLWWAPSPAARPWESAILFDVRLPRAVVAALGGAGLGLSGAAMQGLFRNALAEPGVLGVSSGATLGAVLAIYAGSAPLLAVPGAAFLGALASASLVHRLAHVGGLPSTSSLLLAGVAVSGVAGALGSLVLTLSVADWELGRQILSWMMGGLEGRSWSHAALAGPPIAVGFGLLMLRSRELDALALGEDSAASLGVDVPALRRSVLALTALTTGATVAVMGAVGFLGLMAPHAVRALVGPSHRAVLPGSALMGALGMLGADALCRSVSGSVDLRPGVVMALLGGPFFLALMIRQARARIPS